eukprot:3761253-Prorocentrum_lima.AAC.1
MRALFNWRIRSNATKGRCDSAKGATVVMMRMVSLKEQAEDAFCGARRFILDEMRAERELSPFAFALRLSTLHLTRQARNDRYCALPLLIA